MALMGMTLADTVDYVSNKDPAKIIKLVPVDDTKPDGEKRVETIIAANASIFKLRPLSVFMKGWVYDNASQVVHRNGDARVEARYNETNIQAVRFGLVSVENFHTDKAGNNLTWKPIKVTFNGREYEAVPDNVLSMFGLELVAELAAEIKRISEVSVVEEKNSEEASSRSA